MGLGTQGFWGCAGGITIGDDTIFGNYVSLHAENHIFSDVEPPVRFQGVHIRVFLLAEIAGQERKLPS